MDFNNLFIMQGMLFSLMLLGLYLRKIGMIDVYKRQKYVCDPCGYVYDPEVGDPDGGIEPGTAFEDIPDDWVCPLCGMGKDVFSPVEE